MMLHAHVSVVCIVTLIGAMVVAAFGQAGPTSRPAAPTDRTHVRELIERLGREPETNATTNVVRTLSHPRAEVRPSVTWSPLIRDRAQARLDSLATRALHRAYDGAPPVIPHSRHFANTKTCLECHADGIWLGERFGPPLSHPTLLNCMQCHVETKNLDLPLPAQPILNTFEGLVAPEGGLRAWDGAPPVMPHTTMMRTRCLSCHGPDGYPGLRTDHPDRLNCVQCHGVPASLDLASPFFTGEATMLREPTTPDEPDTP